MRYGRGYNQRGVYLTETVIVEKGEKIEPKTRDSCRKTCTLQKNAESPNLEGAKPPDGVETRNEDAARHATKWRRRMEARSGDAASHGETRHATEWRRGTPRLYTKSGQAPELPVNLTHLIVRGTPRKRIFTNH